MTYSAVVFDFFGTLTPSIPGHVWDEHAARSSEPLGIPAARWREALDASFPERALGSLGDLESSFRALAGRCGVEPDTDALAAACANRIASQLEIFGLREDALSTIAALRDRGLRVGVLSDCTSELAESWSTLPLSKHVDAVVFSCAEGRRKPDRHLFEAIATRLGVPAAECLYIGDGGGYELTGARGYGMTPYMLRASDWYDNDAYSREDDWAGPYVDALSAVVDLATD